MEHDGFQTDSRSSPSEENFVGDVGRELGNRMNKTKEKTILLGLSCAVFKTELDERREIYKIFAALNIKMKE